MDKIFHSTFDFFTHALPGFCALSAFFILDTNLNYAEDFLVYAGRMNIGSGVFMLIASYITGFAVNPLGRALYRSLGFRLFKSLPHAANDTGLFISNKFILIREFSPNNFRYVETWHMFCAMSHNLAVASLLMVCFSLAKIAFCDPPNALFWWAAVLVTGGFFFIFLHRAVKFNLWAADDLNAAIKALRLEERAANAALPPADKGGK